MISSMSFLCYRNNFTNAWVGSFIVVDSLWDEYCWHCNVGKKGKNGWIHYKWKKVLCPPYIKIKGYSLVSVWQEHKIKNHFCNIFVNIVSETSMNIILQNILLKQVTAWTGLNVLVCCKTDWCMFLQIDLLSLSGGMFNWMMKIIVSSQFCIWI
jgi:hypothetical protein